MAVTASAQLLWKISGQGLEKPSYLFGTHHLAPDSLLSSLDGFSEAINASDIVMAEVDMTAAQTMQDAQRVMLQYAKAPADSTLSMLFSPEQLDSINSAISYFSGNKVNIDVRGMDALKPSFVSIVIIGVQAMNPENAAKPGKKQIDTEVLRIAKQSGKEIKPLETIEQQVQWLMGGSVASQARMLMETVRNKDKDKTLSNELIKAYVSQDLDFIEKVFLSDEAVSDYMRTVLIDNRNATWLQVLQREMQQHSIFVAVGAGHLVGPTGLLSSLRKNGYKLTPVVRNTNR